MSEETTYNSIEEIEKALKEESCSPREAYDYILKNYEKAKQTQERLDKSVILKGSADQFHNLGVEFAKRSCMPYAATIVRIGTLIYPLSTDLLADAVKYYQESGLTDQSEEMIEKLLIIDHKYWTWRTFVFTIDYYKDGLSSAPSIEAFEENKQRATSLIKEFKKYIPHDERAYMAEAELYLVENNYDSAICTLKNAIDMVPVAPQCCMKLSELYLQKGAYENALTTAQKGLLASMQDQPSVSTGYIYFLLAMSMDAQRLQTEIKGEIVSKETISKIVSAYQTADKLLVIEGRASVVYRRTIRAKLEMIKNEENIESEERENEAIKTLMSVVENARSNSNLPQSTSNLSFASNPTFDS